MYEQNAETLNLGEFGEFWFFVFFRNFRRRGQPLKGLVAHSEIWNFKNSLEGFGLCITLVYENF